MECVLLLRTSTYLYEDRKKNHARLCHQILAYDKKKAADSLLGSLPATFGVITHP